MTSRLKFTLKAWPVVAAATIGIGYLTQGVASLFGVEFPEQLQMEAARVYLLHAFDSPRSFCNAVLLLSEVLLIAPALPSPPITLCSSAVTMQPVLAALF